MFESMFKRNINTTHAIYGSFAFKIENLLSVKLCVKQELLNPCGDSKNEKLHKKIKILFKVAARSPEASAIDSRSIAQ